MPILEVSDLSIAFHMYAAGLRQRTVRPISGLHLALDEGKIVAVVGASGSGKSLLAQAILGILPEHAEVSGTIRYAGEVLTAERQAALRGKDIAYVPQSVGALDPLMRAGRQVQAAVKGEARARRQQALFERFQLDPEAEQLYPFQLSGGMARRVLLATALAGGARVIVADEPTPGLDPEASAQALGCFRELADEGAAVLLITHDIEAALAIADQIAVFYAGTTVEIAPATDFAGEGEALRHPYAKALWQALPRNGFTPIPGSQPSPDKLPAGCMFAPRCERAAPECALVRPKKRELRGGWVWCDYVT